MWCSSPRAPSPTGRNFRRKAHCKSSMPGRCCAVKRSVGQSVVVIDWRADWIGIGIAEHLAQQGRTVRLAVSGIAAGETLPFYVRDQAAASLHKLGIKVLTYMRLYGSDSDSVYLQHQSSAEAVVIDKVDTLVLCTGHRRWTSSRMHSKASTWRLTSSAMPPRLARPKRPSTKGSKSPRKFRAGRGQDAAVI